MDNFKLYKRRTRLVLVCCMLVLGFTVLGLAAVGGASLEVLIAGAAVVLFGGIFAGVLMAGIITKPLEVVWQDIVYLANPQEKVDPPKYDGLAIASELLESLLPQIRQLAGGPAEEDSGEKKLDRKEGLKLAEAMPVNIVCLNEAGEATYANESFLEYLNLTRDDLLGKSLADNLTMSFEAEPTFEQWQAKAVKKVNDQAQWRRVRLSSPTGTLLHQCDLLAYYTKGLFEEPLFSLVMIDKSVEYSKQDEEVGYVAMAVHELRTPLTIMRGYIEVFQKELKGQLNPEMADFMKKLSASAQQLAAFVSNILNVARIEQDQLTLHLSEQKWPELLHSVCDDLEIRAQVNGRHFEYNIHAGLPTVGVDRVSIHEVMNNLLDNAIKYSGSSKRIIISAKLDKQGMVETTVQDFGIGIPQNVLPHLFDKFYRSHRSRDDIYGTGLGLFLSRALVEAHGGNIWVKSKEGEGSIFGFTLQAFKDVASNEQKGDNEGGITRSAHGWIKNHSLYRR